MFDVVVLVILFPAIGLFVNLLLGRRYRGQEAGIIASVAAGAAFLAACVTFAALLRQPEGAFVTAAPWFQIGELRVAWAIQIDTLSVTMMLLVTGVATLIHIYAVGYMHGDERFTRFFVYMNLFLVMMLILVSANNYLVMFVGWEGVGLCSFFLIGFWFDKAGGVGWKNSLAARKAFIVNRIGDFGLLTGIFLIFWSFGTLDFVQVFQKAKETLTLGAPVALGISLLLFIGAAGKSAQIPLFVWLPDAMAGPTPVSALIHAATMVTAGIYMIARSHVLFDLAPAAQHLITLIGAATALLAATIAVGQFDIKRVLAYSTISQLGFMMAAVGMGAYIAALFHLMTHAFFKALLFLTAGSVIHGVEHGAGGAHDALLDPQDMRIMGGLRFTMPLTSATYIVGTLALIGLPPFAGFFSKDEILAAAMNDSPAVFLTLIAAASLTAFYMARQALLVFWGAPRTPAAAHAVENPPIMTIPLVLLALLSALGAAINLPGSHALTNWLGHTLGNETTAEFNLLIASISAALALFAIAVAYHIYSRNAIAPDSADPLAGSLGWLFVILNRKWYVDELYALIIVRPFKAIGALLDSAETTIFKGFDRLVILITQRAAAFAGKAQTGELNWNSVGIVGTLIVVLIFLLLRGAT